MVDTDASKSRAYTDVAGMAFLYPDERGQLASGAGLGTGLRHRARDARRQNPVQVLGVTTGLNPLQCCC